MTENEKHSNSTYIFKHLWEQTEVIATTVLSLIYAFCFQRCLGLFHSKHFVVKLKTSLSLKGKLPEPLHPQLSLSVLILSIHLISWLPNNASSSHLNMTRCIHLSFPSQINNSIESSPHGLCLSPLSFSFSVSFPCSSPGCFLSSFLLFSFLLLCKFLNLVRVFHG